MNPFSKGTTTYLSMLKAAITNEPLDKCSDPQIVDAVLALAKAHNTLLLIADYIDSNYITNSWEKVIHTSFASASFLETEAMHLFSELDAMHLDYIPLKGWHYRTYYPENSMRQMGDLDILIGASSLSCVEELAKKLSYQKENDWDATYHKAYKLPPFFEVEFHTSLCKESYFEDAFANAVATNSGNRHEHALTPDDLFCYHIYHGYNHFKKGGIGMRYLTDLWLILKHEPAISTTNVQRKLKNMNCSAFASASIQLCTNLFGALTSDIATALKKEQPFSDELLELFLAQILKNGSFGSTAERFQNEMLLANAQGKHTANASTHQRAFFLLKKAFPSHQTLCNLYPVLLKRPYLTPFYRIKRIVDALFFSSKAKNALLASKQLKKMEHDSFSQKKALFESLQIK